MYSENAAQLGQDCDVDVSSQGFVLKLSGREIIWNFEKIHPKVEKEGVYHVFKYGSESAHLRVLARDGFLSFLRKNYRHWSFTVPSGNFFPAWGGRALILGSAFFLFLTIGAYFYLIPWLAGMAAQMVPVQKETELGETLFKQMVPEAHLDSAKSSQLQEFFKETGFASAFQVKLHFVKEPVVNAFAIPGGHIVVYQGILQKITTPEELAGLLAHEVSHVNGRHSARTLFRMAGTALMFTLLLGDVTGLAAVLADNAESLRGLQYSRALEKEADENGFEQMKERGLDALGMVKLFETLQKESSSTSNIPAFLQTHPDLAERIADIHQRLKKDPYSIRKSLKLMEIFKLLKAA